MQGGSADGERQGHGSAAQAAPSISFIFIPRLHQNLLLIILHLQMPNEQLGVKLKRCW